MKKIKKYSIVVIICLLFNSSTCTLQYYTITVHNNTNHNISVLVSLGNPLYPDTLLPVPEHFSRINPIRPGVTASVVPIETSFKQFIQFYGSDTIIIFIFHTDTLNKHTWDEIREGYKILKRYDISWQEMEELNGMISYPPTEAMRNIRQFPPFGQ